MHKSDGNDAYKPFRVSICIIVNDRESAVCLPTNQGVGRSNRSGRAKLPQRNKEIGQSIDWPFSFSAPLSPACSSGALAAPPPASSIFPAFSNKFPSGSVCRRAKAGGASRMLLRRALFPWLCSVKRHGRSFFLRASGDERPHGALLTPFSRIRVAAPLPACLRNDGGDSVPPVFLTAFSRASPHSLISVI